MESLLQLQGLEKRFPGTVALDHVDFDLYEGEVHALMGENGAGKSTLIKALTGVHPPDSGTMSLQGKLILPQSPEDAVRHGISTVYQEVNLVPNLTVMENLLLGREPRGPFGIRWKEMRERAESAIARLGLKLDVRAPLSSLSVALQQMVAISRALDVSAKVLILDEPTSSLDSDEVAALFTVIRQLKAQGLGVIFVTHFLDQMYEISDRITVLRNGKKVGTWNATDLPRLELVTQMIGRDASELERSDSVLADAALGSPILETKGLGRRGSVSEVTLSVSPGETVGLAGLLGSGRTETVKLLFGVASPDSGSLKLDGRSLARLKPKSAIRAGIGYCSEDRKREGIFPELTVRENILILAQVKSGWYKPFSLQKQRSMATDLVGRLKVQPADIERPIQTLSGGNQQKALLARWLAVEPRLLLLDEPTRGIDVGAKFEIMALVENLRQAGRSFVFVSSELPEIVRSCTKVLVMRDRKAIKELESGAVSEERIVQEIAGS
ncbi:MAG: sugar ABC transporter ATP-binding protein [Armatimonadetes bacterium]|nr:sugar ABC transporter ATP-binding protein [Armatimonadota bacterium]